MTSANGVNGCLPRVVHRDEKNVLLCWAWLWAGPVARDDHENVEDPSRRSGVQRTIVESSMTLNPWLFLTL